MIRSAHWMLLAATCLATGCADHAPDAVTTEQLRASVAALRQRVQALEDRVNQQQAMLDRQPTPAATAAGAAPTSGRVASRAAETAVGGGTAGSGTSSGATQTASNSARDDDDQTHALERALVVTGNLLLPPWRFELQPSFSYANANSGGTVLDTAGVTPRLLTTSTRSDQVVGTLDFRMGLPWSSQLDLLLPVDWARTSNSVVNLASANSSVFGVSDLQVGLAKQFLDDRPGQPGLIGSVFWQPGTAQGSLANFFSPLNNNGSFSRTVGYDLVGGGVNLVKRIDPIVFTAGYSHVFAFSGDRQGVRVDPGDADNFSAGALLAASPEVSLRGILAASYYGDFALNGRRVIGSDEVLATFTAGASITLGDRYLLDVTAGAGLTPAAPNWTFGVALPVRF